MLELFTVGVNGHEEIDQTDRRPGHRDRSRRISSSAGSEPQTDDRQVQQTELEC